MKITSLLLVTASFLLFFGACRKDKASWDSRWTTPIVNDTIRITDFENDSTLGVNGDGSIQVLLDRSLVKYNVLDLLEIPDTSINQNFTIALSSITIQPGTAYVDEVKEHDFNVQNVVLKQARIKTGSAEIRVTNPLETAADFVVELPGVTKNGIVFNQAELVPARQNGIDGEMIFELDLSGYLIDLTGENGQAYNVLQSKMKVSTVVDGPTVTMTNQDIVNFDIFFKNLKIDYAFGYLGDLDFQDTITTNVDFFSKLISGDVVLNEINLDVEIYNGIKAVAQGKITHLKSLKNGQTLNLNHPQINQNININAANVSNYLAIPSLTNLNFNNNNSNIVDFISFLGDKFEVGFDVNINPWGNISNATDEVFPNSELELRLKTDFPLELGLDNLTYLDTINFDFSNQSEVLRIKSGGFSLTTNNSFPFGFEIELQMLDEDNQLVSTIESVEKIDPAPLNNSGNGHDLIENELFFEVPESTLEQIQNVKSIVLMVKSNSTQLNDNVVFADAMLSCFLKTNFILNTAF